MTRKSFSIVALRIQEELGNIDALLKELGDKRVVFATEDKFTLRAVGSILHDFYVLAENIFKIIAREIDERIPRGEQWYRELLLQMTFSVTGVRPALLSKATAMRLDEFRAFRYIFRNIYGFNLSAVKIEDLVIQMPSVAQCLEEETEVFVGRMQEILPE